ncbi:MAG: hypothetical protein J6A96_03380 [Clostridia bacterium]|nr:hypothetical protein [Clostridia bacterium]
MKYLSFDIECCDGTHMCEFGYVIIDEQFNVIDRAYFTINPCHKFNLTGRNGESDIKLAFKDEVYFNSPKFDYYYDTIKRILTTPDCQIIGFSLSNDTTFLATAYALYEKEPIRFTYYDFQKLYQGYTKSKNRTSVQGFVEDLKIDDIRLHKSDDDAWAVIKALQVIGEKENLTLPETIEMLKKCSKNYRAERAKERNYDLIEKINNGNLKAQNEFLKSFIQRLSVSEKKKDEVFFGKTVCISSHFQKKRFNEFLAIIERIYFFGATYTGKASVCDIFIEYQDGEDEEVRLSAAKQAIEHNERQIKIISLEETLIYLQLTKEDLTKIDHINGKEYKERKKKEKGKAQVYIDKTYKPTTIGDILKAKGFNFDELPDE